MSGGQEAASAILAIPTTGRWVLLAGSLAKAMTSVPADLPSLLSTGIEGKVTLNVAGVAILYLLSMRALEILSAVLAVDGFTLFSTASTVVLHRFSFADEVDLVRRDVANVEIVGSTPIIRSMDT